LALIDVAAPDGYQGAGEIVVATDRGVFLFGIRTNGQYVLPREPNGAWLWTPPASP
jgi:hypothetical protein